MSDMTVSTKFGEVGKIDYLGDSVYIGQVIGSPDLCIFTFNGITITNPIILEPEVTRGLLRYLARKS